MSNPNKAKGTRAESKVVLYMRRHGIRAKRKALTGSHDEGDVELIDLDICLEVKTGKQTDKYNRAQLNEWLDQANVEEENSGQKCYLIITRYHRILGDAEVWYRNKGETAMTMEYLSDWIKRYSTV